MHKLQLFRAGGTKKLQVVTDFDFTLTKFFMGEKRGASCHRLIEGSGFIPQEYVHQADALFNYYYPIEISSKIPQKEKEEHMQVWATKAGELLAKSGLTKTHIKLAVAEALRGRTFGLREDVPQFFELLQAKKVPVLLFSAGIGDIIEETLVQQLGRVPNDVFIVSNHMIFKGESISGWTEPVFHVFNKKASAVKHSSPFFKSFDIDHRQHVLLLGDSLGDITMSDGLKFNPDSIIRVGFLNDKVDRLPQYLSAYDVVILGDPGFSYVNAIIESIVDH